MKVHVNARMSKIMSISIKTDIPLYEHSIVGAFLELLGTSYFLASSQPR